MISVNLLASRLALVGLLLLTGCFSTQVTKLQPDLLRRRPGVTPIAAIEVRCVGFYVGTLGLPECDLDRVLHEQLGPAVRKIGAHRAIELKYSATPDSGFWWLTKLLGFRSARARALAVVVDVLTKEVQDESDDVGLGGSAPSKPAPKSAAKGAGAAKSGAPGSQPTTRPAN